MLRLNMDYKVDAVVVTYYPDMELLTKCVETIVNQVRHVFIVDNTPNGYLELEKFKGYKNCEIIYLKDNYGIAYAQNVGIKKSLELGSAFILLSDQDTVYPESYIEKMLDDSNSYYEKDKVAAIAPTYKDINRNAFVPFIKHSKHGFKKKYVESGLHEISQAIASGLIIVSKHLEEIGLMNEELFLYWVDLEWCWKAIYKGYKLLGNANVYITHREGNIAKKLLWKTLPIRSPVSHYYIIRNGIYLGIRCKFINLPKRFHILRKSFLILAGIIILSDNKFKNLKYTLFGMYHGAIGRTGKWNEKN